MSDLIDLTSPEEKKIRTPKLTSPLIPLPDDKDKPGEPKHVNNPIINLEACGNLDDNPFDCALRKTSEFVSKSQDPFEIVWEKSLDSSSKSYKPTRDHSGKPKNNPAPKINKTVDGFVTPSVNLTHKSVKSKLPTISIKPPTPESHDLSILDPSTLNDSFLLDSSFSGRPSTDRYLKRLASDYEASSPQVNLSQSILNQSTLDDSFTETSLEDPIKSLAAQRLASCVQRGLKDAEAARKVNHLQRSLSQGCQLSPHYKSSRSYSTPGVGLDKSLLEISSREFLNDPLNKGFLNTSRGTISDLSAIRKFSSASGGSSSDTGNTINRAFITSNSLLGNDAVKQSINSRLSSSFIEISDLKAKLSLLKAKTSLGSLERNENSSVIDPEAIVIDHNITSDSVFTDEPWKRTDDRSLSIKLEQMLSKSSKLSDSDELPSRIPSETEVLTDNEVPVENLIELSSDTSNSIGFNSADKVQSSSPLNFKSNDNSSVEMVRELEKELIDSENKPVAASLLMDLKKLIKAENNPQAIELLKNLEKLLGVKCQSNADLLEIYMNSSTNPSEDKNTKSSEDEGVKAISDFTSDTSGVNSSKASDSINSSEDSKDKSQNSSTLKLIAGIQESLEKLLSENVGQPKLLLKKLNNVFNSVVSAEKTPSSSPIKTARVSPMKNPGLNRSVTSITRRSVDSPTKRSFGLKRRTSMTQIPNTGSMRRSSSASRSDSPKKSTKSRLSSSAYQVTESHQQVQQEVGVKIKPVPVIGTSKLRKKPELEVSKKGPMKAVIPLGNMHRRASLGKRIVPTTPPRSSRVSIGKTSTPNNEEPMLDCLKKPPKTKPLAASTPEGSYKSSRSSLPVPKSPRPSCSISPVTPKTPRVSSPRVTPKISPRPQSKNNSLDRSQVKISVSSPTTPKSSPRVTKAKESQRLSLSSTQPIKPGNSRRSEPLKHNLSLGEISKKVPGLLTEKNTPVVKVKPLNFNSKFGLRRAGSFKLPEKENKFIK